MGPILNHARDLIKQGDMMVPGELYSGFLDGDWQFHTSLEPDFNDAKLVCLEEITKLDPTINELYHLQLGWRAWRNTREDVWQYEADTTDES
jgi:hypothetical protein